MFEYTWERLKQKGLRQKEHYLGGKELLAEIKRLCDKLKALDSFYECFSNSGGCKDRVSALSPKLERLIETEEKARIQTTGRLASEDYELITSQLTQLKDIVWSLKHDVLENIEKIKALGSFEQYDENPLVVRQLKAINLVFNNLDRLEVRGRDSAGISLFFVLDDTTFSLFQKTLQEASLLDEFEARQAGRVLVNCSIKVNRRGSTVSLAFTYKIAAEIGSLGDNVQYLRKQVHEDAVFQHLIRLPHLHQTTIAHTRWASVGEISEANCHPVDNLGVEQDDSHEKGHVDVSESNLGSGTIHVCLNGDIDNYMSLKRDYERETGNSIADPITTDTKIIPLQIEKYLNTGKTVEESVRLAVNDFDGSHVIAMHTDLAPGKLFLAQKGSGQAMFVGLAKDHYVPASETYGFVEETSRYVKMAGDRVVEGISGSTQGQLFVLDQDSSGFMVDDTLDDTLVVAIIQSGTTTDTNRAVDMAREQGAYTLAIVNRRDSDITLKVDGVLYTSTGRDIEMSVASTNAYYSQIAAGSILGLKLALSSPS